MEKEWLYRLRSRLAAHWRARPAAGAGALLRWTGIALAAVLIAAVVTLYFLDWNRLRGPIGRYASHRLGREVRIDGDLKVDLFRWQPHVEVGGLYIGNPAWVGRPSQGAATIRQATVEFRLIPALFGHLILPVVRLDQPRLLVLRAADGRTNWQNPSQGPRKTGAAADWQIPPIRRFLVHQGEVEMDDAIRKLRFRGTIESQEQAGRGANAFQLAGSGDLNGKPFRADVHGGALLNVDESRPYPFAAEIRAGDTRAVLNGSILHPFHLDRFEAEVTFEGRNLADLYYLTGLALPSTPPFRVRGHLSRADALYRVEQLFGTVGHSDLHGVLSVDVGGPKPLLRGDVTSRLLDFTDLGALVGGGAAAPKPAGLLPDTPLHTERLRQMDADVEFAADSIRSRDFPLTGLATHITLRNGVLTLKPLAFAFTQGKLAGSLSIDARRAVPVTAIDVRLSDLNADNFISGADKPLAGILQARAVLTGRGNSVHKAAASARGSLTAVVPSGRVRRSIAEWLGINVINALGLNLTGDESDTALRCAIAHFEGRDGVMTARQFLIDTGPVRVEGGGSIDLGRETLDLRLQGKPKQFQLFRLRAPISVSGSLAHPALGVDAKPLATQGALGLGLGALNPVAALLAFIDPGLAHDANCAALIDSAHQQGAPVRAANGKS